MTHFILLKTSLLAIVNLNGRHEWSFQLHQLGGGDFKSLEENLVLNTRTKDVPGHRDGAGVGATESRDGQNTLLLGHVDLKVDKTLREHEQVTFMEMGGVQLVGRVDEADVQVSGHDEDEF